MGFLSPALLLVALPAFLVVWRQRGRPFASTVLRLLVAGLLCLALAGPYLSTASRGRDLVFVVDRSRSMPADARARTSELLRLAEDERRDGDRIAVVAFGARAAVEALPSETARFETFERDVAPDGSDLGEALETALGLLPEGRHGSLVLLSDGEENAGHSLEAARRAFARGVRIDVVPFARPPAPDLSVERLDLPGEVEVGEPFQFSAWVRADARVEAGFTLLRGEQVLARGTRVFEPGPNRMLFRDVGGTAGVAEYRLVLDSVGDRTPENDRGLGALAVRGSRPVLVLNDDGAAGPLAEALRGAAMPVVVTTPEATRLTPVLLTRFRAVVLENVAAHRLGSAPGVGLDALRDFVLERGGGLLVTGGKAAFGVGGYHLSPIDELLPVSMELRQEHRKLGVALVIVMDRSGSMGMPATGGTKMDLANLGASAAIELLSGIDSVGVIAVDSAPHTVADLGPVTDPRALASKVRRTRAGGGGIFVYSGLLAAGRMLEDAPQMNRHVILFSDAADSEEQGGVPDLVERFGRMGTSLSVIALGTEADADAAFLKRTAEQGGGGVYFTTKAEELPRLFAQDTLTVARSSFLEEPTGVRGLPDLFALGELALDDFPTIEGYNLNYLRPGAQVGAVTTDEYKAPLLAFWYQGLGRVAAYSAQVGGGHGQALVRWHGFAPLFVTLARWLAGQEEVRELFPSVRREGATAVVSVEVDPEAPRPPDTSHLVARLRQPDGRYEEVLLERTEEDRYEARVDLADEGVALGTVRLGEDRFVTLPPITLPYSPEFERQADPERGPRKLRRLARESGGAVSPAAHTLFRGPREARTHRVVSWELALAALLLFLVEVVFRRLDLWSLVRVPRSLAAVPGRIAGFLRAARERPAAAPRPRPGASAPPSEGAAPEVAEPAAARKSDVRTATTGSSSPPPRPKMSVADALEAARKSAGKKLDR